MEETKRKINFRLVTALIFIITVATLAHIFLEKETGGYFYWSLDYGWEEKGLHLFVLLAEIHYILCLFTAWLRALRLIEITESSEIVSSTHDSEIIFFWFMWIFSGFTIPLIVSLTNDFAPATAALITWICLSISLFILIDPQQFFRLHMVYLDPKIAMPWSKKGISIELHFYSPKGEDKAEWAQKTAAKFVKDSKEEFDERQAFSQKVAIPGVEC